MKTKTFDKTLSLNKTTIVNLNTHEMTNVRGGEFVRDVIDKYLKLVPINHTLECLSTSEGPGC